MAEFKKVDPETGKVTVETAMVCDLTPEVVVCEKKTGVCEEIPIPHIDDKPELLPAIPEINLADASQKPSPMPKSPLAPALVMPKPIKPEPEVRRPIHPIPHIDSNRGPDRQVGRNDELIVLRG